MKKLTTLLAVIALFGLVIPAFAADVTVPELLNTTADNMMMEIFNGVGTTYMVADQWHTFLMNDPENEVVIDAEGGAKMKFFRDISDGTDNRHITYPWNPQGAGPLSTASQGIAVGKYLDGAAAEKFAAAGIFRSVNVGPNYQDKVYLFHGYLDVWDGGEASLGQTYRPCFGINPTGDTSPGTIPYNNDYFTQVAGKYTNIGNANWMLPEASSGFQSSSGGFPSGIGGFHGVAAAWPAEADTISLWAGVKVRSTGTGNSGIVGETQPSSSFPVWTGDHFEIDSLSLHEFSFITPYPTLSLGVSNALINGNFEGDTYFIRNTLNNDPTNSDPECRYFPDWRIPYGWVPIGGGMAQTGGIEGGANDYFAWNVAPWFADTVNNPSSNKGFGTVTRRGTNFMGIMQKVQVQLPAGSNPATYKLKFLVRGKINNQFRFACAGIDPLGGTNPIAPSVIWKETNLSNGVNWTTLQYEGYCLTSTSQTVTVFLMSRGIRKDTAEISAGDTDSYCGASFDDARLNLIPPSDGTPPTTFNVIVDNSADETSRLRFHLSIPPTDPESGVSAQAYKIGTTPGGGEIRNNIPAGIDQQTFDLYDIVLPDNQTIYITVTQTNGVGGTTSGSASFVVNAIDNTYAWNTTPEHVSYNAYGSSDSPSIACAPDGKVYLAYRDSDSKEGWGGQGTGLAPYWPIKSWAGFDSKIVLRSRNGSSWGAPRVIATNPVTDGHEGDGAWDTSLVIDSTGAIHCVYQGCSGIDVRHKSAGTYYRNDLFDAVSTDGGATWTSSYIGPGGTDYVNYCNKAVPFGNGILVAANKTTRTEWPAEFDNFPWDDNPGTDTDYLPSVASVSGGVSAFEPIGGAVTKDERGMPTPSVAVFGANIYAIWREDGNLKFSAKTGGAWSAASTLASGVTARSGNGDYAIAAESGKIHVVYTTDHMKGAEATQPGTWYIKSTDGGATWSAAKYLVGGCWPMIKVKNSRVHVVSFERSGVDPDYKYTPKHLFIDNDVLSAAKAIAPVAFTAQPSAYKVDRTDYSWGWLKKSHIVPASFDIDNSGAIHFAWGNSLVDKNMWWIDYYNTAGNVPQCDSIGCTARWAIDEFMWSVGPGAIRKPVTLNNKFVTAEGSINLGLTQVPYIYIEDENRTAGIRVLCPQNANADPGDDIHVGHKVNIVNSAVTVNLVGLNDPFIQEHEWPLFGEPTIGRIDGSGTIKNVTIQPVSTGNFLVPLGLLSKSATGTGIVGIPEVFDGPSDNPKYVVGSPATGLLVTVFGTVSSATPPWATIPSFHLDDGSGAEGEWDYVTGARAKGIKIYAIGASFSGGWVNLGEPWSVRGVAGTERAVIHDLDNDPDTTDDRTVAQIRVIRPCKIDDPQYFKKHGQD